jgi:hypothetical protein
MNIEEYIYEKFSEAGLKTSSNADATFTGPFSTYQLLDITLNYYGSTELETRYESATLSFNCYGKTKSQAYTEVRSVARCLSKLEESSSEVDSSLVYGIQVLPTMDGLAGYTVMATIIYITTQEGA